MKMNKVGNETYFECECGRTFTDIWEFRDGLCGNCREIAKFPNTSHNAYTAKYEKESKQKVQYVGLGIKELVEDVKRLTTETAMLKKDIIRLKKVIHRKDVKIEELDNDLFWANDEKASPLPWGDLD